MLTKEMEQYIKQEAALNRYEHGKASAKAVFGKFMAKYKSEIDKTQIKEYMKKIEEICEQINSLSEEEIKKIIEPLLNTKKETKEQKIRHKALEELVDVLPELEGAEKGKVVTRFEPSPSGPLHIGHVFSLLLNYWYTKKYNGEFVLRIADTNPKNIESDAYNMIIEDVEWLTGERPKKIVVQSERMEIYYEIAEELIKKDLAYVCLCDSETFKDLVSKSQPCPHRNQTPEQNLELWQKMLNKEFKENEAVLRIKTELDHKNPAVREWVAFRIIEHEHPLTKNKYVVWPMMNFSVAVDDHLNGITHIIRGKDHLVNTERQSYIFAYMGWELPYYLHIGRINFEDLKVSKTHTKKLIQEGKYSGWDDVRLPFLRAFRKRGFDPKAFSYWVLEIGPSKRDKKTTYEEFMKNLIKIHRSLIDDSTKRLFFVKNPVLIKLTNLEKDEIFRAPYHPTNEELGKRELAFLKDEPYVYVEQEDWNAAKIGDQIKLKYAFVIKKTSEKEAEIVKSNKYSKVIHYIPKNMEVDAEVILPNANKDKGLVESNIYDFVPNERAQFERYGFVKYDHKNKKHVFYYLHE